LHYTRGRKFYRDVDMAFDEALQEDEYAKAKNKMEKIRGKD
jgi:hypothetical protein